VTPPGAPARLAAALERAGIADERVIAAMTAIPRELFVPEALRDQAYEMRAVPIGHGQTLSRPDVVASMTEALQPEARDKTLEVGTGSGYQTAVLARLVRRVYTIERERALLDLARERFGELRCHNVTSKPGDGWLGWPEQAPFPGILVTAGASEVPAKLVDQLGEGGVMIVPVDAARGRQILVRLSRDAAGAVHEDSLGEVRFVPLVPTDEG